MSKEIWKDVVGYEGIYEVSSVGRIRSVDRFVIEKSGREKFIHGVLLRQANNRGYKVVCLFRSSKGRMALVHKILATAFIQNTSNLPYIDHIDRNRANNTVANLRYTTRGGNTVNSSKIKYTNKELTSNFKGVSLRKNGKWNVNVGGVYRGLFNTEVEAATHYNLVAKQLYGCFAKLNRI